MKAVQIWIPNYYQNHYLLMLRRYNEVLFFIVDLQNQKKKLNKKTD